MSAKHLLALLILGFCISACKTTVKTDDPNVKVKGGGVEVEIEDSHKGDFCPPGQAKKGNC